MAIKNFKVVIYIEDVAGNAVTINNPIVIRDTDEELAWITGSHIANGNWQFDLPSGISCGWKFGVETADGVYTEDANLSGTISGNNLGAHLTPIETIEDA